MAISIGLSIALVAGGALVVSGFVVGMWSYYSTGAEGEEIWENMETGGTSETSWQDLES